MNKAAFLDRDGTINVDYGYVYQYEKFVYIDGVKETLKKLQDMGYLLIIITNQSGVARGYYSEADIKILHEKMCQDLKNDGIIITDIYYCPHLSDCTCRKPQPGLFYQAAKEHQIDMTQSIALGDKLRDLSICDKEEVRGFLITDKKSNDEDSKIIENKRIVQVSDIREIPPLLQS